MKHVLLATSVLLGMLVVASFACAVLYPWDMMAWTISELATVLAVLSSYLYLTG